GEARREGAVRCQATRVWPVATPTGRSFAPTAQRELAAMRRAIVCVTNDLSTDNRVHRTCTVLQELGWDVLLVGRRLPDSAPLHRPYATRRMRLLFRRGALFYAEYNLRLFLLLLTARAQLVVANDLDTLPAAHLAARLRGRRLVYD